MLQRGDHRHPKPLPLSVEEEEEHGFKESGSEETCPVPLAQQAVPLAQTSVSWPPYRVPMNGVVAVVQLSQVLEVVELAEHRVLLGRICGVQ